VTLLALDWRELERLNQAADMAGRYACCADASAVAGYPRICPQHFDWPKMARLLNRPGGGHGEYAEAD
jgi:hypothetical protein